MNSKKVKSRHENSTTNLKQNFKGQTPLKLSDNENQKTNYSKNSSNINSTTNNISNNKNKNNKTNQNLNRANSSINNSKIIITNSNTSLCNNPSKNNKQNNVSIRLEKMASPSNQNTKKNSSNKNNFKKMHKELKNYKYIFDTYDRDDKELKKSFVYMKTEETKKNSSSKKDSTQKKKTSDKNISPSNIKKNPKNNLNIINNKNNVKDTKKNLEGKKNKKTFTRTFSGGGNKRKNSLNNKNSYNGIFQNNGMEEAHVADDKKSNKISYIIFEQKDENKKSEDKKLKSSIGQKGGNSIKNQKVIKYSNSNQIVRYKEKTTVNEESNQTEIKNTENTFINHNNNINIFNLINDINSNDIIDDSDKNIKNNDIKKPKIKYKFKQYANKDKNNNSSNKVKNIDKKDSLSNLNDKKPAKITNYNQTEIKLPKVIENKLSINLNKINEKMLAKKKSDKNVNSARKKALNINENSNRESNFINKDKNPLFKHNKNSNNNMNIKLEQKNKIKTKKNNYIKKINNISKNYKNKKFLKGSSQIRISSVKGHKSHHNRFSYNRECKSNYNSESKKKDNNNFSYQNNLDGFSTLSNRIKIFSFQNSKTNNYAVVKYPISEKKDDLLINQNNNNLYTEEKEENANDIKINVNNCTVIINISSNWGNKKYLGINEIELFDKKNKKIKISDCVVIGGNNQNIKNIYNNKIHTMNESNMWITNIKNQKSSYDLKIKLIIYTRAQNDINTNTNDGNSDDLFKEINYILIWNFNGIELNRGIKKIEVLDKYGNIYFVGIIHKGKHNIVNYHPYKIKIHQNKNINKLTGNLIRRKNLFISSCKHNNEQSIEFNNNSCSQSIVQQNNKKKEEKSKKNIYYSLLRLSSKKEEIYSEIKEFFPGNQVSSSRSCTKDVKKECKIIEDKKDNNKFKKIFNTNKKLIYEKKNKYQNNTKSKGSDSNLKFKSNKISQENLFVIPNIKQIIPEEKDHIKKKSNSNSNLFNDNIPFKQDFYSDSQISILSLSQNQNMLLFKKNNSKNSLPYILFQKIRINILSNYGNKTSVGLTGLNLIDMYNKKIDIEAAISIGALPKDLNTVYQNENDNRIFENLFNGINNTIDENNMWLTLINPNPYIEICFEKTMTLSKIEIWNYNEALSLDKGTKEIEIMFDSDENRKYCVMLWKGLGIDYFNYYQTIYVEKLPEITKKIIHLKYNHLKFVYNTNYLPIGFVIKIIFVKNFGNKNRISLKKMEFFDENNKKLEKYTIINDNIDFKKNKKEDFFYYHDLYDFRKNIDSICNNLLFICFEEIVQIKYIRIENTSIENLISTSSKVIQLYIDDILIFEGVLNQKGESILLFDKKDKQNFKNIVNINNKDSKYVFKETICDKYYILKNTNI